MDTLSDDPLAAALAEEYPKPEGEAARLEIVRQMHENRELAHAFLFAHRHPLSTPDFHKHIIWNWHDPAVPFYEAMAFREGANDLVTKPVDAGELIARVRDAISLSAA